MSAVLGNIVDAIDAEFGEGYAKKNPTLVGHIIQAELLNDGLAQIAEAIQAGIEQ